MASSSPQAPGALFSALPQAQGLYDPRAEKDACGVAFVATLTGEPSHRIVQQALTALRNLEHRGASGAEPDSGDGAGSSSTGSHSVCASAPSARLGAYFPSLSCRTIVYKGMVTTLQLEPFYPRPVRRALHQSKLALCTRATRPTPSRPGRSPSRSA
jgi:glutamate synthase domain-containing protein 1